MRLSYLLSEIITVPQNLDREITGLSLDSRFTKKGDLFFAYKGYNDDGRNYIKNAIEKGAVAILCEGELKKNELLTEENVPIFFLPNLSSQVGIFAAKFYNYPSQQLTAIGVTGTNGKTSITQFIAEILTKLNQKCGVIGTLGIGFPKNLRMTGLTTPDVITIQQILSEFIKENAKAVAIEASSQGLHQKRLLGVDFKIAVFTNLTRDHLDYHKDMESYALAKQSLFLGNDLKYAVINADDEYGIKLLNSLPTSVQSFAYTVSNVIPVDLPPNIKLISVKNIKLSASGLSAQVSSPWGEGLLHSSLLGRFNLSNLLAVLTVLCLMDQDLTIVLKYISSLKTVSGRMQALGGGKLPLVVVDFAHTPDALEKALLALREHCSGKLWCVFGCGGDKDRGKRSIMGQIAERYSDQVIITNDNPRCEDPKQITDDILQGLLCPWAVEVEHDRWVAISHAIDCAGAGDIILLAGKGHEDYQIIGENKIPFNDLEVAKEALFR